MSLLPAWAVRTLRNALILSIIFVIFIMVNVFVILASQQSEAHGKPNRKFTLGFTRQYAEQIGLCNRIDLNNKEASYNATVINICREIHRDEELFFKPRPSKVNTFKHKFLVDGKTLCKEDTNIVVLVHSLHSYVDRRSAIRETWGNAITSKSWSVEGRSFSENITVGFVLGYNRNNSWNINLYREAKRYNDIIMGDFIDDYKNMTLKSLLGLKWVLEYCPNAQYFVKSDDDMIINFPHLLDVMHTTNMTRAIMGPINIASRVLRKGKWSIPVEDFPFYFYPPYESGSCYVISGDIVEDLYRTSEYVPWIFIDDVYITGIVGKIIGVSHIRRDGFAYWSSKRPNPCDLVENKIITGTKMNPHILRTLWKDLQRRPMCPMPTIPR